MTASAPTQDGSEVGAPLAADCSVVDATAGIPEASTTSPSGANDGTCSPQPSVSTIASIFDKSFKGPVPKRRPSKSVFKRKRTMQKCLEEFFTHTDWTNEDIGWNEPDL